MRKRILSFLLASCMVLSLELLTIINAMKRPGNKIQIGIFKRKRHYECYGI